MKRRPRECLDTIKAQRRELGFDSLAKPVSYVPKIASAVAEFCYRRARARDIDGIIFSGDLATTGMPTDITVAKLFLSEAPKGGYMSERRTPTLRAAGLPIYVLPGNHDKYIDNSATPNSPNFELAFEDYMPNLNLRVSHKVCKKDGKFIGFVFADFCLRSRLDASEPIGGPYGEGRVYGDVLGQLRSRTLGLRERFGGINVVWVIHFAPFECGASLELLGRAAVLESARTLRVKCMLCGHTHKMSKFQIDEHTTYCAGSAGCVDSEHDSRLHVIHFDVGDDFRIVRENYKWNLRDCEFKLHNTD